MDFITVSGASTLFTHSKQSPTQKAPRSVSAPAQRFKQDDTSSDQFKTTVDLRPEVVSEKLKKKWLEIWEAMKNVGEPKQEIETLEPPTLNLTENVQNLAVALQNSPTGRYTMVSEKNYILLISQEELEEELKKGTRIAIVYNQNQPPGSFDPEALMQLTGIYADQMTFIPWKDYPLPEVASEGSWPMSQKWQNYLALATEAEHFLTSPSANKA
jgi:hypothetical protein